MSDVDRDDPTADALRRANPVPLDRVSPHPSDGAARALLERVLGHPRRRSRRPLLVATTTALLVVFVVGLTASRAVHREDAPDPFNLVCYASDSLTARRVVVSAPDVDHACAAAWQHGPFGAGVVPEFDACVLSSGGIGVFPGESGSVCPRLGLPEFDGGDQVARFSSETGTRVAQRCIGLDAAERMVRDEIAKFGLRGWTVAQGAQSFDAKRPCASLAFVEAHRKVLVVAIADPYGTTSSAADR